MSIDFPFAHIDVVRKTFTKIKNLKNESVAADKAVANAKYHATDLATEYKDDITALAGLPFAVQKFADVGSIFPSMHFLPC